MHKHNLLLILIFSLITIGMNGQSNHANKFEQLGTQLPALISFLLDCPRHALSKNTTHVQIV